VPQLPPSAWAVIAALALLLLVLIGATTYGMLRRPSRARIATMPGIGVAGVVALAAVPWLVVLYADVNINVHAHDIPTLLMWTTVALLVFALLVLLPLAALLLLAVWVTARVRERRRVR